MHAFERSNKISSFLYENNYVKYFDFACGGEYDKVTDKMKGVAHYRFNVAEKIGNALLTPLVKAGEYSEFSSFERTWIVLGVIAAIPAALGVLLKKIGETFNSKNFLRQQAIQKIEQMKGKQQQLDAVHIMGEESSNQSKKANELPGKIDKYVNNDLDKKAEIVTLFNEYKDALQNNTKIEGYEKEIDKFFKLNPELGEESKKFAKEAVNLLKKTENSFLGTPEMKDYEAILNELDKK